MLKAMRFVSWPFGLHRDALIKPVGYTDEDSFIQFKEETPCQTVTKFVKT
jgi:hypothetical protein